MFTRNSNRVGRWFACLAAAVLSSSARAALTPIAYQARVDWQVELTVDEGSLQGGWGQRYVDSDFRAHPGLDDLFSPFDESVGTPKSLQGQHDDEDRLPNFSAADAEAVLNSNVTLDPATGVLTLVATGKAMAQVETHTHAYATANASAHVSFTFDIDIPYNYTFAGAGSANDSLEGAGVIHRGPSVSMSLVGGSIGEYYSVTSFNDEITTNNSFAPSGELPPGRYTFKALTWFNPSATTTRFVSQFSGDVSHSGTGQFNPTFSLTPAEIAFRWIDAMGGVFSEGENWQPGVAPGAADTAIFDLPGSYTIELDENVTNEALVVAGGSGTQPTIHLDTHQYTAGLITVGEAGGAGGLTFTSTAGSGSVQADDIEVRGDGSQLAVSGSTLIFEGLSIADGGRVRFDQNAVAADSGTDPGVMIGADGDGVSQLTIQDESALILAAADLRVGGSSAGSLRIETGGDLANSDTVVVGGQMEGVEGEMIVTGESPSGRRSSALLDALVVGNVGVGRLVIDAGGEVQSKTAILGESDGDGSVTVDGRNESGQRSTWTNEKRLVVGKGSQGSLTVNGGDVTFGSLDVGGLSHVDIVGGGTLMSTANGGVGEDGAVILGSDEAAGTAKLTVSGVDADGKRSSFQSVHGNLEIGLNTTGMLRVENGGEALFNPSSASVLIGVPLPGEATVTGVHAASDQRSLLRARQVNVGFFAEGTLRIAQGGLVESVDGVIGDSDKGSVFIHGVVGAHPATWAVGSALNLGFESGGDGLLAVSDGGRVTATNVAVGLLGEGRIVLDTGGQIHSRTGGVNSGDLNDPGVLINGTGAAWQVEQTLRVGGSKPGHVRVTNGGQLVADQIDVMPNGGIDGVGGIVVYTLLNVFAGGTFAPGNSPGTLTVEGDAHFQPGSLLEIEFAGLEEGQFDQLIVTGDAVLGGSVEMVFRDGYAPQTGDVLGFLEVGGDVSAESVQFVFPNLVPGFQFSTSFSDGAFSLMALNDAQLVAETLPGDYNGDGSVDAADYIVWRKTGGTPETYNTWRTNFGRTAGAGATGSASVHAAVPEPATIALCLLALPLFMRLAKTRTRQAYTHQLS